MRLSEIKGQNAFKTVGKIVGYLKEMFSDDVLNKIVAEQKKGWILDFFTESLNRKADVWMKMYLALNPEVKEDDVSLGSVIKFAYEFKNDSELMSLFFSQGEQKENSYSGSPMVNIEETEKK